MRGCEVESREPAINNIKWKAGRDNSGVFRLCTP